MIGFIVLVSLLLFAAIGTFYATRPPKFEMTELEKERFKEFKKKHLFARVERKFPPECGYYLYARALFTDDREDITDYDFMINNI